MQRQHPLFSTAGLVLTALLLALLGLGVWLTGGKAFSPGSLSSRGEVGVEIEGFQAHSDFENQCKRCHQPLKSTQDALCLDCHVDVAQELQNAEGMHGLVGGKTCRQCHPEHQGRDFDALEPARKLIDHSQTGFSLLMHPLDYQARPIPCGNCHTAQGSYAVSLDRCTTCHADHDPAFMRQHLLDFGKQCLGCHDGSDRMANFDHAQTQFPLEGSHAALGCVDCHFQAAGTTASQAFAPLPTDCAGCHSEPPSHAGLFTEGCANCHSSTSWKPALWQGQPFDHFSNTGFSLARHPQDFSGNALRCTDCHTASLDRPALPACLDCHTRQTSEFMQQHQADFGLQCLECHDGVDRMASFNHAAVFPLEGAHAQAKCLDCHAAGFTNIDPACVSCHAEPEIHAGFFGTNCADCHTTQAWSPALLRQHSFPLDHGESGVSTCQTCHPNTFTQYTCYGCHAHPQVEMVQKHAEEGISSTDLPDCVRCHPAGQKDESND